MNRWWYLSTSVKLQHYASLPLTIELCLSETSFLVKGSDDDDNANVNCDDYSDGCDSEQDEYVVDDDVGEYGGGNDDDDDDDGNENVIWHR